MSHRDPFEPAPRRLWAGGPVVSRLLVAAVLLALSSPLPAQLPAPGPAPAPTPAPILTRSLTLEYIIVVVMIGAAVFAVCRSSRRN